MHSFYENVVQVMFEHYAGRFFNVRNLRDAKNKYHTDWPLYSRGNRKGDFKKTDDDYNIDPKNWTQMGKDTRKVCNWIVLLVDFYMFIGANIIGLGRSPIRHTPTSLERR